MRNADTSSKNGRIGHHETPRRYSYLVYPRLDLGDSLAEKRCAGYTSMNRQEELELTVQMLIDQIRARADIEDEPGDNLYRTETAESILAGQPCNCAEYPFPHKRSRACFRRY